MYDAVLSKMHDCDVCNAVQAIQKLSDLYAKEKNAVALRNLLTELRPLFAVITKAKTAKIVRTIIETIAKVPDSTKLQVWNGRSAVWCKAHFVVLLQHFHVT
jgi:26S proteasome regulatory subunit N6